MAAVAVFAMPTFPAASASLGARRQEGEEEGEEEKDDAEPS